jgi:type IV pilus assembly protein PilE
MLQQHGYSLFELLIVLAIMGILAGIAYPIYTHAIIKTRRAEAKIALINLANHMEIYYLGNNHSYANASLAKLGINEKTDKNFYHLSVHSNNNTYKLAATATFTDTECRRFLLNELGEKTSLGNSSSCW